ncbi:MAG: hypothetical protein ABFS46_14245, partial [Myxococcota bacterium]
RIKGSKDNRFTVQPDRGADVEVCLEADELVDRPGLDARAQPLRFRAAPLYLLSAWRKIPDANVGD